jgi:hypothetical protein
MTVYPKESLEAFPPYQFEGYRSTVKRSPRKPLVVIPHTLSELTGPVYGHDKVHPGDEDLTKQHAGEPLGERIVVHGRVLDEDGRPVPDTLVRAGISSSPSSPAPTLGATTATPGARRISISRCSARRSSRAW